MRDGADGASRPRLRYSVAASLDGFIAGPGGEFDWIPMDPAIDFGAFLSGIDTVVMGRKTFEAVRDAGGGGAVEGKETIVFSSTLDPGRCPEVSVVSRDAVEFVTELKGSPGRDIWLFGGGALFRSLLDADLVDTVEVGIVPVLLGEGVPLLPPGAARTSLTLKVSETFPSGIVLARYEVAR